MKSSFKLYNQSQKLRSLRAKRVTSKKAIRVNRFIELTPDLNYPNNTFSNFYCLIPDEIRINNGFVAITDFNYPLNYLVNLGSLKVQIPKYLNIDNEEIDFNHNINDNINSQMREFENEFVNVLSKHTITQEELYKIEQIVTALEQNIINYMNLVETYSHVDKRLKFNEFCQNFHEFFQRTLQQHSDFLYFQNTSRHFFKKIFDVFENFVESLKKYTFEFTKVIIFDFTCFDRLPKKDVIELFFNKLKRLCNKTDQSLVLKDFVKIIDFDDILKNLVTIHNNTILFNKEYPIKIISNFYVYTDIITDKYVNNSLQPLLRIISVKGKLGDYVNNIFNKPYYEPINKTHITKIQIIITDQNKRPIDFQSGPIFIKIEIVNKE